MKTKTQKQRQETIISMLMAGCFLSIIFGGSSFWYNQTPPIITIDNIDISISAQEFKFQDQKQTYQSLVKEHCHRHLQLLKEGDILISGKFTVATFFQNFTINHRVKSQLLKQCPSATAQPARFPTTKGTDLLLVLEKTQTEIQAQRSNGINYPVALTIVIDAAEPVDNGTQFDENTWISQVKNAVENLLKEGDIAIAFIVADGQLKETLTTALGTLSPIKIDNLEGSDREALEWVIKTARNLPQKSN